jgi:trehalose 6-phosphate phosphatase
MTKSNTSSHLPIPDANWALFLDLDGTLIDIAARPDCVVVPDGLVAALSDIRESLGGALALVSGRTLTDIDRLTAPFQFVCAAEHGAILRFANGKVRARREEYVFPEPLRTELRAAAGKWPGVTIEDKTYNIVAHYRQAPTYHAAVRDFTRLLAAKAGPEFEALPARMAFEIRHRKLNKGAAVQAFMSELPFAGRTPVFVGDDVTDEDGFRAAVALGGVGLDVRVQFGGEAAQVRNWIASVRSQLRN